MSSSPREAPSTSMGAYRDGFGAALEIYEARRGSVMARAATLGPEAVRELPKAWRRALSESASRLSGSPSTVAELDVVERALAAYEQQVEDALSLIPELRRQRMEGNWWRRVRRWHVLAAAAVAAVMVAGVIAGKRSDDAERAIAACRAGAACSSRGLCSLSADGACTVAINADCESSEGCAIDGHCTADNGVCRAYLYNCRGSQVCVTEGRCWARSGECVDAADAGCDYTLACHREGSCLGQPPRCSIDAERNCRESDACRERGVCFFENDRCVPPHVPSEPPADAEMKTFPCDLGQCVEFEGHVVATADLPCLRSSGCTTSGLCSMIDGQCVVREPWQCQRSVNCAWAGACSLDTPGAPGKSVAARCVARDWNDCAKTPGCVTENRCRPSGGVCVKWSRPL